MDIYSQKSNYERRYKLINTNSNIDLMPFIKGKNISYSKFEQTIDGKMSANTMSFTLSFPYNTEDINAKLEEIYIDCPILKDYIFEDFKGLENPIIYKKIPLSAVINKGDNISFIELTEENLIVFDGVVSSISTNREKTKVHFNVEVKDKTSEFYRKKHLKNELFKNVFLSRNSDKENSLLHIISKRFGLKDEEINLPDIDKVIPFIYFKKDELIVKELAEACRLFGGVYTFEGTKLTVKSEMNRTEGNCVFDSRNILSSVKVDYTEASYEKMKVTYKNFFEKEKQEMWSLVGKNGNLNDANLVVYAGQKRVFSVKWYYEVDTVRDYELGEVYFKNAKGEKIEFQYSLEIDQTGGTLTLDNKSSEDIYVVKFKIKGYPLFCQDGNESYYPANIDTEKLATLENKFVQNPDLALFYLKSNLNSHCKSYKKISFSTNVNNKLEPSQKIYFNHKDYKGYIVIEKISFKGVSMDIDSREYLEAVDITEIKTIEKSSVDELEVISTKYLENKGIYDADKPLIPKNLLLVAQWLGFDVIFDEPIKAARGHYLYIKKENDTDFTKIFINTNKYFYNTGASSIFDVKVSCISLNGVEGECSEVKKVKALEIPVLAENKIIAAINASGEEVNIDGRRINIGSGLLVEGDKVVVRDLGADNIRGKRLEGLEIVSENIEKTERVYINSGKVVQQKRDTVSEEYKTYDHLIMHASGEVSCPKSWSNFIDLKAYNNGKKWSSLNLICFVGNQYSLDTGIATSREIIKEWRNNDPNTQEVKFKVCGNANVSNTYDLSTTILNTNNPIIVNSLSQIAFTLTVTSHVYTWVVGGSVGEVYYRSRTTVYIQFDNEVELVILDIPEYVESAKGGATVSSMKMTKQVQFAKDLLQNVKTCRIRVESYYPLTTGNTYYGEPKIVFSGTYKTLNFVQDKLFDATVQWLAIGNS